MTEDEGGQVSRSFLPPRALMPEHRDIVAEVTLHPTEHGGLHGPARSVYFRPQVWYDGLDWDAVFDFNPAEWAAPGQTLPAYVAFLSPECHVGTLYVGKEFLVRLGQRVIGCGVVTGILNLKANAHGKLCDDSRRG
jgi:translation elongation factor EF-Tu-like GTPase